MTAAEKRAKQHEAMRRIYDAEMPQYLSANERAMYRAGFVAALKYAIQCAPRVREMEAL